MVLSTSQFPPKKSPVLLYSLVYSFLNKKTHSHTVDTYRAMDMDFPDPQELEWLEANNSSFQDDDFDIECPPSPPSESEPPESPEPAPGKRNLAPIPQSSKPALSLPPIPSITKPQENSKKRFRFDMGPELMDPGHVGPTEEDKRSKVDNGDSENNGKKNITDNDDEDWLRYSPPLAGNGDADVAMVAEEEVEVDERVLSRYATEIDGDCVPVTGLDGERVYAKICRVENVERVKKMDMQGDFEG